MEGDQKLRSLKTKEGEIRKQKKYYNFQPLKQESDEQKPGLQLCAMSERKFIKENKETLRLELC